MGEKEGYLPFPKGFTTAAVHYSQEPEQWDSMAVVTPLVTSTTYKQHGPAEFKASKKLITTKRIIFPTFFHCRYTITQTLECNKIYIFI